MPAQAVPANSPSSQKHPKKHEPGRNSLNKAVVEGSFLKISQKQTALFRKGFSQSKQILIVYFDYYSIYRIMVKSKELGACSSQTASPFSDLNQNAFSQSPIVYLRCFFVFLRITRMITITTPSAASQGSAATKNTAKPCAARPAVSREAFTALAMRCPRGVFSSSTASALDSSRMVTYT